MIRILQLGMTDNLGGIETFLMNYYRNIDRKKIQFDFVNIYPSKLCFQNEIEKLGGRVYAVSSYYKHPFRYIREVVKIINDGGYKIVHANMNSAAMIYPLIAGKKSKAKIVISHAHNASSDKGFLKDFLHETNKHFIPKLANNYFACSEKAGEWFYNEKIRKSEKYKVIHNAIDIQKYRFNEKARKEKRKELGIADSTLVIGHVGRFVKQKNHEFLIDVFQKVHEKNEDSKLILVGIGPLEEKTKRKVNLLGLKDSVLFLEQRSDVNELYNAMDVFALPSLYEGLPMVGVEAQANGLPCLLADTITDEVSVTQNCYFLPARKEVWNKEILSSKRKILRDNDFKKYNIKDSALVLMETYSEMVHE